MKVLLIGVDLAWGEKMHDGVCCLELEGNQGKVLGFGYPHGDRELLGLVGERGRGYEMIFMTVDAPLVCPNRTGTRPVDRLTHRMFHRQHAACHPANTSRCPRPTRVARLLIRKGFSLGWEVGRDSERRTPTAMTGCPWLTRVRWPFEPESLRRITAPASSVRCVPLPAVMVIEPDRMKNHCG